MFATVERDGSKRLQTCIFALTCATFAVASTASQSQVSSPQIRTLAVKADVATLCALVGKMQVITLKYVYDPATAEPRELEPYAVGFTRKRDALLFARQTKGYSKSAENGAGDLPGWRNFRLNKIKGATVNVVGSTFESLQPNPNEHRFIAEFVCDNESVR
jgi:hypothetical protein